MTMTGRPGEREFWKPELIWSQSLLARVRGLIPDRTWCNLDRCGQDVIIRSCRECGRTTELYYRCSLKFCPQCNWRMARQRAELLRRWSRKITQPKHVVLTMRNFATLTRRKLRQFQNAFRHLRRTRVFEHVSGGCISMEITNEGRGFHLHAHCLLDARWIDAGELARTWGRLVNQEFGIVKILDARERDYATEVCKYVVKGAELVRWEPEEISQLIHAVRGVRFFSTFGTLFKMRREIAREIASEKPPPPVCPCGCGEFIYEEEMVAVARELSRRLR